MLRQIVFSASLLLPSPLAAQTPPRLDGSYFCTAEAAGGIGFDEEQKKWRGTIFRADSRFLLALKYVGTRTQESGLGQLQYVYNDYMVTYVEAGSQKEVSCYGSGAQDLVPISQYGGMKCRAGLEEIYLDFDTLRYLQTYLIGFTDGADNNDNTPSIVAGSCTKIPTSQ